MGGAQSVQYVHAVAKMSRGEDVLYRNPESTVEDIYETQDYSINSIYSLFMKSKTKFSSYRCLGTKSLMRDPVTGSDYYEYVFKTFDQIYEDTQLLANVISGYQFFSEVEDTDFSMNLRVLGISSVNREEWILTDLAANLLGITTVPLYETLGTGMLALILEQTQMSTLFGNSKCLENILTLCGSIKDEEESKGSDARERSLSFVKKEKPEHLKYLRQVICFEEASSNVLRLCMQYDIQLYQFHVLMSEQKASPKNQIYDHSLTKRDAIFTISYTSGTEKNSKGVMLSNENFLCAIVNILKVAGDFSFTEEDTYISYLPLAHVFDRLGVYAALSCGAAVGFFGGQILKIIDDLQLLKPTIFVSVPRLLNKVYDRINQTLSQASYMKQWLFYKGISSKQYYLKHDGCVHSPTYDRLVFSKAKQRLGGRVRIMITASAPIADNVLSFLKCVFCCPVVEAYGQTESCGASFSTKLYDNQTGHVGGPSLGIEFKLKDIEEMGYTRKSEQPKGEILLRGPSIFVGYFKNRELTNEAKDEEGWLRTGDVGMILPGNALKIIDRVKNIFKLSQGEYIVTEKLERIYEQSPFIAQMFIYGDSLQNHIVSIIYPEITTLKEFCLAHNLRHDSLTEIIKHPEVIQLIQNDMMRLARENNLNSLEQVRGHFRLVDQEFEVGVVLTPTMKIRRQQARLTYEDLIRDIYHQSALTDKANNV